MSTSTASAEASDLPKGNKIGPLHINNTLGTVVIEQHVTNLTATFYQCLDTQSIREFLNRVTPSPPTPGGAVPSPAQAPPYGDINLPPAQPIFAAPTPIPRVNLSFTRSSSPPKATPRTSSIPSQTASTEIPTISIDRLPVPRGMDPSQCPDTISHLKFPAYGPGSLQEMSATDVVKLLMPDFTAIISNVVPLQPSTEDSIR